MPNIRVVIANDIDALLVSMARLLRASGDIDVLGTARNGDGYLTKPFKGEGLLREVRSIAARHGLCSGGQRCA